VISLRDLCTGRRPVHFFKRVTKAAALGVAAAILCGASPALADARGKPAAVAQRPGQTIADFYKARRGAPLWLGAKSGDAADQLVGLLATSTVDGIAPGTFDVAALRQAIAAARAGKPHDIDRADQMLSGAFVRYVSELRRDPGVGITYVDAQLRPSPSSPLATLLQAANTPSIADYVANQGWMHPIYGQLRQSLVEQKYNDEESKERIALNLKRARVLPAGKQRYILVNAAQQRLYMYEGGKPVDSMVVVVGKPKWPTPMLSAYVRFAALNPYWYVPPDLAGEDVGQFVVKQGLSYLDKMGYEIVDDWTEHPNIIDPKTVDWKGVVDGKVEVMIRQKPGPQNFMGRMKFMFPNEFGVYLHDNPRRELFLKSARFFSGGCVRLEDAARLGRWLFGHDLVWQGAGPEEKVMLDDPVPVYITYLTAMPDGNTIAYYDDVYGRDAQKLAGTSDNGGTVAASR